MNKETDKRTSVATLYAGWSFLAPDPWSNHLINNLTVGRGPRLHQFPGSLQLSKEPLFSSAEAPSS